MVKNNNEKYGIVVSMVFEVAYFGREDIKKSYGFYTGIAAYKGEEIDILNPAKIPQERKNQQEVK